MGKQPPNMTIDPPIRRAVVIGAGTMGAQLAAHLANAGVHTTLLDIVPPELTKAEERAGLTKQDAAVRNRLAREGLEAAKKISPAAFFSGDKAAWIAIGNLEDDLDQVAGADWVIEAIVENLKIKRGLMERIDALRAENTIVSTNTSGIPVNQIAEGRSGSFRRHFLGTHFFNPPRYLKLLEVIPAEDTDPEIVGRIRRFAEGRLGKGAVICKDTPNFIGNRLGSVGGAFVLDYALEHGYSVEEVDALTGPLIGRPKTASFRLLDLVGLDVANHVRHNLAEALPDDEAAPYLTSERAAKVTEAMIERGWLGNKAEAGFYKKVVEDGAKEFWPLNLKTLEHEPPQKVRFDSVGKAKDLPTVAERVGAMLDADDRGAQFVRALTFHSLAYASKRVPEIADSPLPIDRAVRWGFMHDVGPFELWDSLGVAETAAAMKEAGQAPAEWVDQMLAAGVDTFYRYQGPEIIAVYHPADQEYKPLPEDPRRISLPALKADDRTIAENDGASLIDLGDGVACLEFHTKGNTLDEDVFRLMGQALERVETDFLGLVIASDADNFSLGANLFTVAVAAQNSLWDQLDEAVRTFQELNMKVRNSPRPVVVAPAGMTLGGGAEMTMHAARAVAAAESYIGLVEVGAGVVPAGGGCKEMLRRVVNPVESMEGGDALPPMQKLFETVGQAKVSRSAAQARDYGFLSDCDRLVMNRDHVIAEAKREVLHLAPNYQPPDPEKIYAGGRDLHAALKMAIFTYKEGGYISEYDAVVGGKLAEVLTGGNLSQPTWVDPWYILDLEREAFLSLAGEEKTQARMWSLLQTGKPLRN
ncbi:MAG: 3-hydroxyacyl-CoA dehydrogenase/enoyl-CoA hydratase family protein [Anaerolineales bacterium]